MVSLKGGPHPHAYLKRVTLCRESLVGAKKAPGERGRDSLAEGIELGHESMFVLGTDTKQ